jgi:hypothetical protein
MQGAGGREQGEKEFEPYLLFFTQFGFIASTYLDFFSAEGRLRQQKSNNSSIKCLPILWVFHFEF